MAVGVAGLTGATAIPYVGWAIGIAAAYIDAVYVMPELAGPGRQAAKSPRFLGTPVGSNESGAPRVWAIGSRIRVPTHILWQDSKARETTAQANKGGTATPIRRVYINALVSLNDRETQSLEQLRGNGKLLLYKTRNLIEIITSQMSATYVGGGPHLGIFMASVFEPSLTDKFQVGDIVRPSGFVKTSGPDGLNGTYWEVVGIADHAGTVPSSMALEPRSGQTMASMVYTGGSPFSPARIERVDDATVAASSNALVGSSGGATILTIRMAVDTEPFDFPFPPGELVKISGIDRDSTAETINVDAVWRFDFQTFSQTLGVYFSQFVLDSGTAPTTGTYADISSEHVFTVEFASPPRFTAGLFPVDFVPEDFFYPGSETQGEDPLIVASKGTGNVSAYRGSCYQGLQEFYATQFGDQLPFSLEAMLRPDAAMTWAQAVREVLVRAGIRDWQIDTAGVDTRPFGGMFLRGAVPTLTAMQPLLVAGQLLGQERDGVLAMFTVDTADSVQIANGAEYSDFGARDESESRSDAKVTIEDTAQEDLPTSIGIRHQDPDNQFADGFQHFGLRNPDGVEHQNEQQLDLSNIVLSRKEARNLATTIMRRAWINRRKYRFVLPASYLDLLENDLVTFTTDTGDVVICRIIQRDIGADFRVAITALAEDVNLAVSGSPVQTGAGIPPNVVVPPAYLRTIPMDIPAITNAQTGTPAIQLAICAEGGGENWAGAFIYESVNGASYQNIGNIGSQAAIGTLDATLSAQDASEEYGTATVTVRSQTVDVTFGYEGDTAIEAATQAEAEAGKNWVMLLGPGDDVEIAAFTTVTANGDRNYTLGGWLRGLRGTSSVDRTAGVQMVMLHPPQNNVFYREFPGAILPTTLSYKVVPNGAGLDDVAALAVSATWRNARPLPVRAIQKTIGASPYDAELEVVAHWSREVLPLGTQPPHAMDEPFEAYRFDIYDPTGATLLRSKTLTAQGSGSPNLRDKFVTYTAAEQTTDGYTPSGSETFWVDVVQIGQFGDSPSILQEI